MYVYKSYTYAATAGAKCWAFSRVYTGVLYYIVKVGIPATRYYYIKTTNPQQRDVRPAGMELRAGGPMELKFNFLDSHVRGGEG